MDDFVRAVLRWIKICETGTLTYESRMQGAIAVQNRQSLKFEVNLWNATDKQVSGARSGVRNIREIYTQLNLGAELLDRWSYFDKTCRTDKTQGIRLRGRGALLTSPY